MRVGKWSALIAVSCMVLTTMVAVPSVGQGDLQVLSVSHSPQSPVGTEDVAVTLTLGNTTNITKVLMIVCKMEPYSCFNPYNMTHDGSGVYTWTINYSKKLSTGWYKMEYAAGTEIGYNFHVDYNDGTTVEVPSTLYFAGMTNIKEPITDTFYFAYTIQAEPGQPSNGQDQTPLFIAVAVIAIAVVALVALLKKKGKAR